MAYEEGYNFAEVMSQKEPFNYNVLLMLLW